jgi:polysaccharide pyruvyl transferase WcaK-like protein
LITSTGVNNIGDQAMFETFVQNAPGRILAITGPRATYRIPDDAADRVRLVKLGRLIYGFGLSHRRDVARFARLATRARSVALVGADVMDGGYGVRKSVVEWALAQGAAEAGLPTRVLGFSWQQDVDQAVADAARSAVESGVVAYLRDPDSADRFEAATGAPARRAADIVFRLQGKDDSEPAVRLAQELASRGPLLLVNVSALIARSVDLSRDYQRVADAARALGFQVLFVPHVGDAAGGDASAIRTVVDRLAWEPGQVSALLTPQQIKALAERASLVLTGRMHLAILALSQGTPAIVLSTQGKVAGLLREVGTPDWCLEPKEGFADQVIPILEAYARQGSGPDVGPGVGRLSELAQSNFVGLAAPASPADERSRAER